MDKQYDIPGFSRYKVTRSGQIISYVGREPRVMKQKPQRNARQRKQIRLTDDNGVKCSLISHRIIMSAKLGRQLETWEQVRHLDSDRNNNHMDNLSVGCAILNMLDDIENGTRQTSAEYISEAISRLTQLAHSHQ